MQEAWRHKLGVQEANGFFIIFDSMTLRAEA
jgi:hypothetical protein